MGMNLPYSYDHYGDHDDLYDHRHQHWQSMEQRVLSQQGIEEFYRYFSSFLTSVTSFTTSYNLGLVFPITLGSVPLLYVTIDTN